MGNISCSHDEDYLGDNRKLIQAQGDNQQNANDVAASSQRKHSYSWLGSRMSQGNSRRDGVFCSAPVGHLPGTASSNQGNHSKFQISDTSQSSPEHGFNQYDMYPVSSSVNCTLPILKLREYNGEPLDWPEASGMFLSTVDRSTISDDEKMTHLKTLLTGPVKRALAGMGYSGVMYNTAWKTLERKFGQPHLIIGSQLTKIENHSQLRPYDSASFVIFVDTVGNFVNVLQQFDYSNSLFSSSNLDIIVNKLPADIKRRWFAHIETASHRSKLPNLIELNEWLQEETLVQERLKIAATNQFPESSYRGKQNSVRSGRDQPKNSTFTNDREIRFQKCPLDDGDHPLWKCDKFKKKLTVTERSEAVKQANLCFNCLTGKHCARDCKSKLQC